MTTPSYWPIYTVGAGIQPNTPIIFPTSAPTSSDIAYPLGTVAVVQSSNSVYQLTSFTPSNGQVSAVWTATGGGGVELSSLTADTGTATPSSGNIKISGTTNEITTTASGATMVISVPTAFTSPGSLTATVGSIQALNGNLALDTAGNKILIAAGTNASIGQSAAMTAGTITISTTAVTASSLIFLTNASPGGTVGTLSVGTITAGTSFVINSSSATDTSKVNWWLVN